MDKGTKMCTRIIHLVNPKTDSLTTRPVYMDRSLYSPFAGLLAVAAAVPRERYEVAPMAVVAMKPLPARKQSTRFVQAGRNCRVPRMAIFARRDDEFGS
jgi:hypothetical protein